MKAIVVVAGFGIAAILLAVSWLIPVWPYDWEPPEGARPDADLVYSDAVCAALSILIAGATAAVAARMKDSGSRHVVYIIAGLLILIDLARVAMLFHSRRPWPDFR